jgi:hypothetical protein
MNKKILIATVFATLMLFVPMTSVVGVISKNVTMDNQPPNPPEIDGPPSGIVGKPYEFFFSAVDPDGDNVSFYIEWGDGTSTGWTRFYPPGMDCKCSHAWFKMLRYNLRAKAKDIHGNESDWGRMSIRIPRNKAFNLNFNLLESLFERFPNLFPMLRHLLRL